MLVVMWSIIDRETHISTHCKINSWLSVTTCSNGKFDKLISHCEVEMENRVIFGTSFHCITGIMFQQSAIFVAYNQSICMLFSFSFFQ